MFNPATPLNYLEHTLKKLDLVLLMSVNPGFGGQQFIPAVLDKVRAVRKLIDASGKPIRLEIDGGVKVDNIGEIARGRGHVRRRFGHLRRRYKATISAMRAAMPAPNSPRLISLGIACANRARQPVLVRVLRVISSVMTWIGSSWVLPAFLRLGGARADSRQVAAVSLDDFRAAERTMAGHDGFRFHGLKRVQALQPVRDRGLSGW